MSPDKRTDTAFMREALRLAAKGRGRTSPNPMVGAVVVKDGEIVGRGWHEFVGGPHAEVNALRSAGDGAGGATVYVTLEPCNHFGRTPPCTRGLLAAGVSRVVVGMNDPNPHVEGSGNEFLRSRGIAVETGVLERECRLLNQAFIKHVTTGLPLVTIKAAATLDGKIATRTGDSRWISNERSRRFVHQLRSDLDAIMVGIGTALADNPQLTARLKKKGVRQPTRIVVDTRLRLPLDSQLVRTSRETPVWVACGEEASKTKAGALEAAGVVLLRLPVKGKGVDLGALLSELGRRGLSSLLVEGGASLIGAFIAEQLADELHLFYAPKILGDPRGIPLVCGPSRERMADAAPVYDMRCRRFGEDLMLSARFHESIY